MYVCHMRVDAGKWIFVDLLVYFSYPSTGERGKKSLNGMFIMCGVAVVHAISRL